MNAIPPYTLGFQFTEHRNRHDSPVEGATRDATSTGVKEVAKDNTTVSFVYITHVKVMELAITQYSSIFMEPRQVAIRQSLAAFVPCDVHSNFSFPCRLNVKSTRLPHLVRMVITIRYF